LRKECICDLKQSRSSFILQIRVCKEHKCHFSPHVNNLDELLPTITEQNGL
jgi:hypothetical protein